MTSLQYSPSSSASLVAWAAHAELDLALRHSFQLNHDSRVQGESQSSKEAGAHQRRDVPSLRGEITAACPGAVTPSAHAGVVVPVEVDSFMGVAFAQAYQLARLEEVVDGPGCTG